MVKRAPLLLQRFEIAIVPSKKLRHVWVSPASRFLYCLIVLFGLTACSQKSNPVGAQLERILSVTPAKTNTWSAFVAGCDGRLVFEKSSSAMLTPASSLKLFTVAGALGLLGTNQSFESRVYANGKVNAGIIDGDLNLVCEHDITWSTSVYPSNAIAPLMFIAKQLKTKGIAGVIGKVQCFGACFYNPDGLRQMNSPENQAEYNTEAAKAFREALLQCGISVSTNADAVAGRQGFSAPGTLICTHKSSDLPCNGKPLRIQTICAAMLKNSDNVMADALLRHVGYVLEGEDSYSAGTIEVTSWLANTAKIDTKGMVYLDGSGLSHDNKCSAAQIVAILQYAQLRYPDFYRMLSVGCTDGTLAKRFCGTAAACKVFAKTGSLNVCSALSGFIEGTNGSPGYVFSFIANNSKIDQPTIRKVIDDMVVELAKEH